MTEIKPNQFNTPKLSHIPFPHKKPLDNKPENNKNSQSGSGKRARKPGGYYKNLEKGGGSVAVSLDEDMDSRGVGTSLDEWFGGIAKDALVKISDKISRILLRLLIFVVF